jgi:hypothetical protein
MTKVVKISISLGNEDAKWARGRAKKLETTVSGVVGAALRKERQAEARRRLVEEIGGSLFETELRAVLAEWRWAGWCAPHDAVQ